jgi:hypothetical protein
MSKNKITRRQKNISLLLRERKQLGGYKLKAQKRSAK